MAIKTKQRPDADKVYVAVTSFSVPLRGGGYGYAKGTRLRGDNEVVRAHPEWFAEDGTPESEWPTPFDGLVEEQRKVSAARARDARELKPMLKARRDIQISIDHEKRDVLKGGLVEVGDPIALLVPGAFEQIGVRQ